MKAKSKVLPNEQVHLLHIQGSTYYIMAGTRHIGDIILDHQPVKIYLYTQYLKIKSSSGWINCPTMLPLSETDAVEYINKLLSYYGLRDEG
jgi:hypothetical protein